MTSILAIESEIITRFRKDFAEQFDVTPNPKGATPSRESLDERRGDSAQEDA